MRPCGFRGRWQSLPLGHGLHGRCWTFVLRSGGWGSAVRPLWDEMARAGLACSGLPPFLRKGVRRRSREGGERGSPGNSCRGVVPSAGQGVPSPVCAQKEPLRKHQSGNLLVARRSPKRDHVNSNSEIVSQRF